MAKSILEALFYGKLTPWERRVPLSDERKELEREISVEKQYITEKLSFDDLKSLEKLEDLYARASEDRELAIFSQGFIMGTLIMLEVLAGGEDIISE